MDSGGLEGTPAPSCRPLAERIGAEGALSGAFQSRVGFPMMKICPCGRFFLDALGYVRTYDRHPVSSEAHRDRYGGTHGTCVVLID